MDYKINQRTVKGLDLLRKGPQHLSLGYSLKREFDKNNELRQHTSDLIVELSQTPVWLFPLTSAKMMSKKRPGKLSLLRTLHEHGGDLQDFKGVVLYPNVGGGFNQLLVKLENTRSIKVKTVQPNHTGRVQSLEIVSVLDGVIINSIGMAIVKWESEGMECFHMLPYPEEMMDRSLDQNREQLWHIITCFLLFRQFVPVVEVELPQRKSSRIQGKRYTNQSKTPLTVLDCSWYKTIMREGQPDTVVDPYFRVQRYGPGWGQKRVQMISGYKRTNKNRVAKKLEHKDLNP